MRFMSRGFAVGLAAFAGFGAPVVAQDADATVVVNLFGLTATYAAPPWVTGTDPVSQFEMSREQGKGPNGTDVFMIEYIPKGESFDDWSALYAIHAETPLDGTVQGYRNGMLAVYGDACDNTYWQGADTTPPERELFIIYCPNYVGQAETGEVAVFHMQMKDGILVKNYYHKRVPAFDQDGSHQEIGIDPVALMAGVAAVSVSQIE